MNLKTTLIILGALLLSGVFAFINTSREPVLDDGGGSAVQAEVMDGYLVMAHEAREFLPCGAEEALFVRGDSAAYGEAKSLYEESKEEGDEPYDPLFASLEGAVLPKVEDGFGADYEESIDIEKIISTSKYKKCKEDLIKVNAPRAGSSVESPLTVSGEARGYWFFEATAPVVVVDWNGVILGEGYIEATDKWMTEEFVPFEGTIVFDVGQIQNNYSREGTIILEKHNASDLRELDDELLIPVTFK